MKIAITSIDKYPNGDAGAVRSHAFAKLLQQLGHEVLVVGLGKTTQFKVREYEAVAYTSFRAEKNTLLNRAKNLLLYRKRLSELLSKDRYDAIMVVDLPVTALFWLKKYAKRHQIRLLHDCVEWYSPEQFSHGKWSRFYFFNNCYNTKWIDKQFSVISISRYLEEHFSQRGVVTTRIPVIMDIEQVSCLKRTRKDRIVLFYAGSPGKKDYLKEIVEGIALLAPEERKQIELRLAGISSEQLISMCGVSSDIVEQLGDQLVAMGRISRDEVLRQLEEADFTVLLRSPELRYAKAGFPTKVVESLASGTPVILNLTSDLSLYIEDEKNGMIVSACSAEAFSEALRRVLSLSKEKRKEMQQNARCCAEENFDYSLYAKEIKSLLDQSIKGDM